MLFDYSKGESESKEIYWIYEDNLTATDLLEMNLKERYAMDAGVVGMFSKIGGGYRIYTKPGFIQREPPYMQG